MTDSPEENAFTARLWRCEACGKWSHAKRNPRRHLVETAEWREWFAQYEPDNPWGHIGMGEKPDQYRECGPFAEWSAVPAEEAERHLAETIARTKRVGELRTEADEILAGVTAVADENDDLRRRAAELETENDNYHTDLIRVIGERNAAQAKVAAVEALAELAADTGWLIPSSEIRNALDGQT